MMTDATNYPIEVGATVESRPLPGSQTPNCAQGSVTSMDLDNGLVFVRFEGKTEDFGCLPIELVVVVAA